MNAESGRELFSVEAEQSVIGSLLMDNACWDRIVSTLLPEHFYVSDHARIFAAIGDLIAAKKSADVITVLERLKSRGELQLESGESPLQYLQELLSGSAATANISLYADIVRDRALMRKLFNATQQLAGLVKSANGLSATQLVDAAQTQILALTSQTAARSEARPIADFIDVVVEEVDQAAAKAATGGIVGLPTGLIDIDGMLNGIGPTDLVVLAGRPSHGKSALALNICEHVSVAMKIPSVVFSLEMSANQLIKRLMASQSGVHGIRFKDGKLSDREWDSFARVQSEMRAVPIYVCDTPYLNVAEISAQCRRLKRATDGALGLIVIDYLGLMNHGDDQNRASSIERTTNALKNLAKELVTPVLLLSQVNRGCESRPNKRPMMSDLRESGGIEQDADTVMFIYRHHLYHTDQPEFKYEAELIVAKQRSGPVGSVQLYYDAPRTRFRNAEAK